MLLKFQNKEPDSFGSAVSPFFKIKICLKFQVPFLELGQLSNANFFFVKIGKTQPEFWKQEASELFRLLKKSLEILFFKEPLQDLLKIS